MNFSDEEIIQELKKSNREAFEQVFREYYNMLCLEAKGYIHADHLVEEIVCDVFTKIWLNRERLLIKASLKNYLIKSVHNNCIDYYRHQKFQDKWNHKGKSETTESYTLADLGEDPLDYMISQELENRISAAIESLPEQYKRAFKLSRFNDLSYAEIATEMNISVNSVKTNIKKALVKLRETLKDIFLILVIFASFLN
jgi:RNA polymerase sigma-70 factor, ECF subfamily